MSKIIFVVGPPASGKTTVCTEAANVFQGIGFTVAHIPDCIILQDLVEKNVIQPIQMLPGKGLLIDDQARRVIYQELANRVLEATEDYVLVEMATFQWEAAFSFYDMEVINESCLMTVLCSLQGCIERNYIRSVNDPDRFNIFVPEEFIRSFFLQSRPHQVPKLGFRQVVSIENSERIDIQLFREKVRDLCHMILS